MCKDRKAVTVESVLLIYSRTDNPRSGSWAGKQNIRKATALSKQGAGIFYKIS